MLRRQRQPPQPPRLRQQCKGPWYRLPLQWLPPPWLPPPWLPPLWLPPQWRRPACCLGWTMSHLSCHDTIYMWICYLFACRNSIWRFWARLVCLLLATPGWACLGKSVCFILSLLCMGCSVLWLWVSSSSSSSSQLNQINIPEGPMVLAWCEIVSQVLTPFVRWPVGHRSLYLPIQR